MTAIKTIVTALGRRRLVKNRLFRKMFGKTVQRWSGIWMLLLVFDIMRFVRRRRQHVIARKVLKDGEVLVISSAFNREHQ